ncbi:dUTP diphosphatase [Sulfuricurvum sp.]|uniref:dUTP diphosphatase n=1 Tax=Sulfuricurvum sp. TaxID=2025608 RepID=UPI003BB6AB84
MNKLLSMLQLQQQLNDATNGQGWEKGMTKDGKRINWRRCVYMESAEMIDSFGWKHWKSIAQPTDYANLQIEIVDVWHFIMSLVLEDGIYREKETHEQMATWMAQTQGYEMLCTQNTPAFALDEALMLKIETIMRRSLEPAIDGDLEKMVDDFFRLSVMGALNLDELYRLYVGKNILNQFRQDHGYKEGSYIKIWNGLEDNAVMKSAWEANPDMSPSELYEVMTKAYPA